MISSKLTWQVLKRNDLTGQADPAYFNPTFSGVAERHSTEQAQTDTDKILQQFVIRKLEDALFIMAPAAAVMIQEYKLFEGLPSFGNVPPFRCAEGHADHNLPFIAYTGFQLKGRSGNLVYFVFLDSCEPNAVNWSCFLVPLRGARP